MRTTLTKEHAAAYQCYGLYIEGASPQMHGTLAKWKLHKHQFSDKLVIILLYQGVGKSHATCLASFAMEHRSALLSKHSAWLQFMP